jgi:hypothetical protein
MNERRWVILDPQSDKSLTTSLTDACIVVATVDRSDFAYAEFEPNSMFQIELSSGQLILQRLEGEARPGASGIDTTRSVDLPAWPNLLILLPFGLGGIYAGFVTLRYFYRFYFGRSPTSV